MTLVDQRDATTTSVPHLPYWPVLLPFLGFPLWWVLGMGVFIFPILAVPMIALLVVRGQVRVPRQFAWWAVFLLFMLASLIGVEGAGRSLGFAVRAGNYGAATIMFIYVYNARWDHEERRRMLWGLGVYWFLVIIGGYLGLLIPTGSFNTVTGQLLPGSVTSNSYVQALVQPRFAEVQTPWGSPVPFVRPAAPSPYANGWGCNYALLVPIVLALISIETRRWRRWLLIASLPVSMVPAFATLNRGMFLALAVALAYAALRFAFVGRLAGLIGVVSLGAVGLVVASVAGVFAMIGTRTTFSETNGSRVTIYREAFSRTLDSPIFGYGTPRPSYTLQVSVGTQGQFWNVMFSHGFIALVAFVGFFLALAWSTRTWRRTWELWLHTVVVIAVMMIVYYGFDGPQLELVFVAAALLLAPHQADADGDPGSDASSDADPRVPAHAR